MRRFLLALAFVALQSSAAMAATIRCDVYAALNRYHYAVSLDDQSSLLTVQTDDGYVTRGSASMSRSGRTGDIAYYLQTGFNRGIELSIEGGGRGRMALCLTDSECYICNP